MTLLKVDGKEYKNGDAVRPAPSDLATAVELIKKSERSLSGKMCVDYVGEKLNLKALWSFLTTQQLNTVKADFARGDAVLEVVFAIEDGAPEGEASKYVFDDMSYTPVYIDGRLMWKDVAVSLAQQ